MVLFSSFNIFNSSILSFFLDDKNPWNTNLSVGNPDTTKAAILADGPGNTITWIFHSIARFIKSAPGSEIPGIPASDTSAMFVP